MKVVVFGSRGRIGQLVVEQALAAGHQVTAVVRGASPFVDDDRLRILKADVRDLASVKAAVTGHDVVISAIGHASPREVNGLYSTAARNYVDAMSSCDVKRLIAVSAWVGESTARSGFVFRTLILPLVLEQVFSDLEVAEGIYRSTSLDWTTVRPGRLTMGARTGRFRIGLDLQGNVFSKISRADVADFIVDQIEDPRWIRASPELVY